MNELSILGERLLHSPKRIARAEAWSSHCCTVNILKRLARDFSTHFQVSRRDILFRKSSEKSEWTDRSQPGKILNITEDVRYSIIYRKM